MSHFKKIGLVGKPDHLGAANTLTCLYNFLVERKYEVMIEERVAVQIDPLLPGVSLVEIGKSCDLAIVVGGDGNMLGAARVLSRFKICVIGVNRGNLGFLTDLDPDDFCEPLEQVLAGDYITEHRFLLEVEVHRHEKIKASNAAVNEAVLHHGKVAHMMQFEVYINESFVYSQRSDGLIISTPTGSTAYSLSGGGPILTPNLDVLTLVPMFPHTLSSRPLVVDANDQVRIKVSGNNDENLQVACDGHVVLTVLPGDDILIKKNPNKLRLVHPKNHDYFHVLRNKLNWGSNLY